MRGSRILVKIASYSRIVYYFIEPQNPGQEGIITEAYWFLKSLIVIHSFSSLPHLECICLAKRVPGSSKGLFQDSM